MKTEYKKYENIEQLILLHKKYSLRSSAFDGRWWIDWLTKNANLCAYWHSAGTRTVPLQLYWIQDVDCELILVFILRVGCDAMETYIEIRKLVCQHLNAIRRESKCIVNDVITGWRYRAFTHWLRHQEKVIAEIRRKFYVRIYSNIFDLCLTVLAMWWRHRKRCPVVDWLDSRTGEYLCVSILWWIWIWVLLRHQHLHILLSTARWWPWVRARPHIRSGLHRLHRGTCKSFRAGHCSCRGIVLWPSQCPTTAGYWALRHLNGAEQHWRTLEMFWYPSLRPMHRMIFFCLSDRGKHRIQGT